MLLDKESEDKLKEKMKQTKRMDGNIFGIPIGKINEPELEFIVTGTIKSDNELSNDPKFVILQGEGYEGTMYCIKTHGSSESWNDHDIPIFPSVINETVTILKFKGLPFGFINIPDFNNQNVNKEIFLSKNYPHQIPLEAFVDSSVTHYDSDSEYFKSFNLTQSMIDVARALMVYYNIGLCFQAAKAIFLNNEPALFVNYNLGFKFKLQSGIFGMVYEDAGGMMSLN